MRLVAGALALALFAPLARAEDPATPPPAARPAGGGERTRVPFRVVRVMPESRQALLFDRNRATHVLVETGGKLEGYTIDDIDDETVTLRRDGQEVVLAAPMYGAGHRRERSGSVRPAAGPSSGGADPGEAAPVDPYGEAIRSAQAPGAAAAPSPAAAPPSGDALPADPSIRVAHAQGTPAGSAAAPIMAGDDGVRVVTAPDAGPAAASPAAPRSASPASAPPPIAAGDDGVRVVTAPDPGPAAPPTAGAASPNPAAASPTTAAASPSPRAAAASPSPNAAAASPSPIAAAASPSPIPAAASPNAARSAAPSPTSGSTVTPGEPTPPASAAASARATRGRVPRAAAHAPAANAELGAADAARAPDKQTLDARALADVMTANHRTRTPRGLAISPASTAEPRAGAASPASAEPRAATAASPATEPRAATATAVRPGDAVVSRSELDTALADFAALTAGVRASFSTEGVVVAGVGDGTIFQRAGLRAGDVVTAVDGVRLRSLDDAANLYARASTARAITAQIVRAGKPATLHVVIQ